MADTYETALLRVADEYASAVADHGGKSLARVATIVVNRGSFFERLRGGATVTASNLERLTAWFRDADNWPHGHVPDAARLALVSVGRPVIGGIGVRSPVRAVHSETLDADAADKSAGVIPSEPVLPLAGSYQEPELPILGAAA